MSSSPSSGPVGPVRLRSIHVSQGVSIDTEQPKEPLKNIPQPQRAGGLFQCSKGGRAVRDVNDDVSDDVKDIKNPLILPASTHTVRSLIVKPQVSYEVMLIIDTHLYAAAFHRIRRFAAILVCRRSSSYVFSVPEFGVYKQSAQRDG